MKKVLLAVAAALLIATPAMSASIVNSAHDLSGLSSFTPFSQAGKVYGADENTGNRLCVFCHTPHGATTDAPLWNRGTNTALGGTAVYNSGTFDFSSTMDLTTIGDAKLCMTCHDGDLSDSLTNLNGSASGKLNATGSNTLTIAGSAKALLGSADFSDDHPVSFKYAPGTDVQGGLRATTTAYAGSGQAPSFLLRGNDEVWCSSCHDVHNPGDTASQQPFLRLDNAQSALCLTCHIK